MLGLIMRKKGFTLLELLIVIVIVGILATLAIIQYKPYKENTLDREAQANLKLIYAAERIYKFESDDNAYYSGTVLTNNNAGINSGLKLKLTTTSPTNWDYTIATCVDGSSNSRFTAKAARSSYVPARYWCLNSNLPSDATDPVPTPTTGSCTCP